MDEMSSERQSEREDAVLVDRQKASTSCCLSLGANLIVLPKITQCPTDLQLDRHPDCSEVMATW